MILRSLREDSNALVLADVISECSLREILFAEMERPPGMPRDADGGQDTEDVPEEQGSRPEGGGGGDGGEGDDAGEIGEIGVEQNELDEEEEYEEVVEQFSTADQVRLS